MVEAQNDGWTLAHRWVHGHIHHAADYTIGPTQIVCNPRGHADEVTGSGLGGITMTRG